MALRAYWSGDLAVGPWTIPVQAGKALQADERDEQLKRLCSCHHQPFSRPKDECPGGKHPWSQAAEDRGEENLTELVYGTPKEIDDDEVIEWAVLDESKLEEIRDAAKLEDLEVDPGDVVPVDDLPLYLQIDPWYLWPKVEKGKKGQKRLQTFAALLRALDTKDLAMVTLWTPRVTSKPKLVAMYPVGDALMMCELPFLPQVRAPELKVTGHAQEDIPERAVEMVGSILDQMVGEFAYAKYEDVTIKLRAKAIKEALAGEPVTVYERAEEPVEVEQEDDLMASLEASLALVQGGAIPSRKKGHTDAELDEKFRAEAPWDEVAA